MIRLSNSALYTGITNDVHKRMATHAKGRGSKYVRSHLPFSLVYLELCADRSSASAIEKRIKSLKHKQKSSLIKSDKNVIWESRWKYLRR
jgi:putative endonuclease